MSESVVLKAPRAVAIERVEDPRPGQGDVLVRTLFSGISAGTQLTLYRGTSPFVRKEFDRALRLFRPAGDPPALYPVDGCDAYEEVGRVEAIGADVTGLEAGTLVCGSWGHRTEAVLPAAEAAAGHMPAGLDPVCGVFSQIGSIALNAVLDADIHVGETVAVFGLGVPGQIVTQLARLNGARVIAVDPNASRRGTALRMGAEIALSPLQGDPAREIRGLTNRRGADLCIEISGSPQALHEAIRCACYNGRVVCSGFFPGASEGLFLGEEFHHNRIQLICSQIKRLSPALSHRWNHERLARTILSLQQDGRLDLTGLITHRIPFREAARAYDLLDRGAEDCLQVVLSFAG